MSASGARTRRSLATVTALCALGAGLAIPARIFAGSKTVKAPLTCTRGGAQTFSVVVSAPDRIAQGGTYTVRLDSFPSGTIDHAGLRHLHDMEAEYLLPAGTKFVEGSARIVAGTGSANVEKTALVWHWNGVIHFKLPAKVRNGDGYTPPSVELKLVATAPPGSELPLKLLRYTVYANAIVVGDVKAACEPSPSPYVLSSTTVTKS